MDDDEIRQIAIDYDAEVRAATERRDDRVRAAVTALGRGGQARVATLTEMTRETVRIICLPPERRAELRERQRQRRKPAAE